MSLFFFRGGEHPTLWPLVQACYAWRRGKNTFSFLIAYQSSSSSFSVTSGAKIFFFKSRRRAQCFPSSIFDAVTRRQCLLWGYPAASPQAWRRWSVNNPGLVPHLPTAAPAMCVVYSELMPLLVHLAWVASVKFVIILWKWFFFSVAKSRTWETTKAISALS